MMKKSNSIIFFLSMIVVVVLVPYGYHIDLGPGPNSLLAMLWEIRFDVSPIIRFFTPFLYYFEFNLVRILYLLILFILIAKEISKKFFILIGILPDLITLIISLPAFFILNSEGENLYPIIIPIPFLFLTNLILTLLLVSNKK